MTIREMRQRMGEDEFAYWCAYYGRIAQKRELAAKEQAAKARVRKR